MDRIVKMAQQELEAQYEGALTYAVRYDRRWEQAEEAYQRLHDFQQALKEYRERQQEDARAAA